MALRCLNCGETGLRDKAEFCDTCGQQLIVKLDDSIPLLN
jgi:rRNA maturation endonuclease Nob1